MMKCTREILRAGLRQLQIDDKNACLVELLQNYLRELLLFNAAFNVIKAESPNDIIVSHILDSLAAWHFFEKKITTSAKKLCIADIGSGAGFPGIPLACVCLCYGLPAEFILIERMAKRAAMLENVQAILALSNVRVQCSDMATVLPQSFDVITCRAFCSLHAGSMCELRCLLKKNGVIAMYKAQRKNIYAELEKAGIDRRHCEIIPLNVPFLNAERHLLVLSANNIAC